MRLSRIKRLCKENKTIQLIDDKDKSTGEVLQYIGDGFSLYPMRGLPYMDAESLLAVLDIPSDDRPKWNVQHTKGGLPDFICTDDLGNDIELRRMQITIGYDADYYIYRIGYSDAIVFVDIANLNPLEGDYTLCWRLDGRYKDDPVAGYVVAKKGFFFEAMFMAKGLPDVAKEEIKMISGRI